MVQGPIRTGIPPLEHGFPWNWVPGEPLGEGRSQNGLLAPPNFGVRTRGLPQTGLNRGQNTPGTDICGKTQTTATPGSTGETPGATPRGFTRKMRYHPSSTTTRAESRHPRGNIPPATNNKSARPPNQALCDSDYTHERPVAATNYPGEQISCLPTRPQHHAFRPRERHRV